jgi:hypothetical protein
MKTTTGFTDSGQTLSLTVFDTLDHGRMVTIYAESLELSVYKPYVRNATLCGQGVNIRLDQATADTIKQLLEEGK